MRLDQFFKKEALSTEKMMDEFKAFSSMNKWQFSFQVKYILY